MSIVARRPATGYFCDMGLAELKEVALHLSEDERAELTNVLLESLSAPDPHDGDQDSLSEAVQRSRDIDAGKVRLVSEEAFWQGVKADRAK
ncbi:MAG: addiction module protein [Rhodospirillales bacterium]|nr:addiction module protein [Rhodospirillales bacterium]